MFSLESTSFRGFFRIRRQNQHRCEIALHLRLEDAVHRRHHHRVDQAADDLLGFAAPAFCLEGVQQALDLATINLRQARMQKRRRYTVGAGCHLGLETGLAPTQAVEFVGDQRGVDALEDGCLEPLDARGHVAELRLSLVPRSVALLRQPVTLGDILGDECLDDVGLHHVVAQRCQHLLFQIVDANRQPVRARRRSLLGRSVAGGSIFAVLGIVRPAPSAYDLAGQQIARTLLGPEGLIAIMVGAGLSNDFLARFYAIPQLVRQDPQMRYAGGLLEFVRVRKRASGAGFRVLAIRLPLVFRLTDGNYSPGWRLAA